LILDVMIHDVMIHDVVIYIRRMCLDSFGFLRDHILQKKDFYVYCILYDS
jgi:hypothetical protein